MYVLSWLLKFLFGVLRMIRIVCFKNRISFSVQQKYIYFLLEKSLGSVVRSSFVCFDI